MKQDSNFRKLRKYLKLNLIQNQRGQSVVEYVLMLIVSVSLVIAMGSVFSSMNNFVGTYIGEYIVCLMEYGELPSLGVQNTDVNQHQAGSGKKCNKGSFSGTMASSKNSSSSSANGNNSQGSANGNTSNSSSSRNAGNSANNKSSASDKSSSQGSDNANSDLNSAANKSSPYTRGQISKANNNYNTADGPLTSNASDKIKIIEDESGSGLRGRGNRDNESKQTRIVYERVKSKVITGELAEEIEKKSKISRSPSSKVIPLGADGYRFMPYKKTFNPPKNEKAPEQKPEDDFSVGNFLKWIIIIGIIIACFILFGGQIMNYANSDER